MRLGLLGPADGHEHELARAARGLRADLSADRVVYLGADHSLERVVQGWAEKLVGQQAGDETLMSRATSACLRADGEQIFEFLTREKQRSSLRVFESLPGEKTRSVELLLGKVAVMLYDKGDLEEDDILPATLLIFGKNPAPLVKQVGRRWFLSPGTFPEHGIMMVDDEEGTLHATLYDGNMEALERKTLAAPKELKMRVTGAS